MSVSKGLLTALAAVAGASLLTVAYLLGRASGDRPPSPPAPAPAASAPAPATSASPSPAPPLEAGAESPALPSSTPVAAAPTASPVPAAPQGLPAPARAAVPDDPERAAVSAYLAATDRIQEGKMRGDAEGMATEMAAALSRGDTSGLDRLIRETEEAKGRLALLSPPPSCALHQRESLASLDDALDVLRSLRAAVGTSDPAAPLAAVSARATALKSRAETLEREERALRLRYGIAR